MRSLQPDILKPEPELAAAVRAVLQVPRISFDSLSTPSPDQIVRLLWEDLPGLSTSCPACRVGIACVCSFGGILTDGRKTACCESCACTMNLRTRGLGELSSPIENRLKRLGWTMAPYAFGPQNHLVTAAGVPEGRFSRRPLEPTNIHSKTGAYQTTPVRPHVPYLANGSDSGS